MPPMPPVAPASERVRFFLFFNRGFAAPDAPASPRPPPVAPSLARASGAVPNRGHRGLLACGAPDRRLRLRPIGGFADRGLTGGIGVPTPGTPPGPHRGPRPLHRGPWPSMYARVSGTRHERARQTCTLACCLRPPWPRTPAGAALRRLLCVTLRGGLGLLRGQAPQLRRRPRLPAETSSWTRSRGAWRWRTRSSRRWMLPALLSGRLRS